jgi:hypothetical protein
MSGLFSESISVSECRTYLADIDHHHFYPSPSVLDMWRVANGKRRWKAEDGSVTPKPGWLVVYKFGRPADHVGLVKSANTSTLVTLEFNTVPDNAIGDDRNGGMVAEKRRTRGNGRILGYIDTSAVRQL